MSARSGPRPPVAAAPGPHVLRDYALLADGERAAVLSPRGEIAWMCFPGWSDNPVFASLLGGHNRYQVAPAVPFVWGGQYEWGSLIWRNRWVLVGSGIVECCDALAYPGSPDRAVLVRRLKAIRGTAPVDVHLEIGDDFGGSHAARFRQMDDGVWEARWRDLWLRWQSPDRPEHAGHALKCRLTLSDTPIDLVLELSTRAIDDDPPDADEVLTSSVVAWREAVPDVEVLAARDVRHSIAVITGMTTHHGGMVAAATTSLPERANQGRDYDYRYVWLRDQCYAGQAFARASGTDDRLLPLLDRSVRFVTERVLADGAGLRPAYRADGGPVPEVRPIDIAGYPGASDVATGNGAGQQFQLDVLGEILQLLAAAARRDRLESDSWAAAETAADAVAARWLDPDNGIWELTPDEYTHSRLSCVAGLRALAAVMPTGSRTNEILQLADAIVARMSKEGLHPSGRWQRTPADTRVDAALLLPAIRGAVPPDDPRSRKTREAVESDLVIDGYAYRFRASDEPLGRAEGAFLLCGFWCSLAAHHAGDRSTALRFFERTRAACGPAGIFTEEYDVHQRQLRGNFPQSFVHALLIETAVTLTEQEAAR